MTLRLEIVSRQRQSLRASAIKEFGPDGGTIGRSLQTDWPLPDAQRFLSSQHASIDFRSGSYYIVDTSTNGVYINGAAAPVGKGKPQRLFTGDVVRIGEYEIRVEIDTLENTMETLVNSEHVDPVEAKQHVEAPDPTGHDLVDAFEITGVGIEFILDEDEADTLTPLAYSFDTRDLALEESRTGKPADGAAAKARKSAASATARKPSQQSASRPQPAPAQTGAARTGAAAKARSTGTRAATPPASAGRKPPAPGAAAAQRPSGDKRPAGSKPSPVEQHPAGAKPGGAAAAAQQANQSPARRSPPAARTSSPPPTRRAASAASAKSGNAAARALVEAFCDGAGVDASSVHGEDPRQVFFRLGQTFSALLAGITDSLRLRSLQKAELRQAQTVIQRSDNNMLKFSANAGEALARLLAPQTGEYLDPVECVADAFADLNAHQRAVLKVLPKVLNQYLQQLDPDELEDRFASTSRNRLLGAANKLRYWDLYRDVYLVMSQQAEDELPEAFTKMLGAAFEEEINRTRAASDAAIIARKVG
jgi:type VI secretion system protein